MSARPVRSLRLATVIVVAALLASKLAGLGRALLPGGGMGSMVAAAQAEPAALARAAPVEPSARAAPVEPSAPEPEVSPAERRLTVRVTEMAGLQARLEQLEAARREHGEANWSSLVKVYETMKPREAAAIFNDMELPVLLEVIGRMKESKAAALLGAMQPDRARLLTTQLAAQRTRGVTVPGPG